jgi:hypothetical protein
LHEDVTEPGANPFDLHIAVTRWLTVMDGHGFLARYFDPPLTAEQRQLADLEEWILGVT